MTYLASSRGLCDAGRMNTIKITLGFGSAAALVCGLLVATPASAATPDVQTQSARSVDGSARKARGRVPGAKCKKKGKIVNTELYGTLKCKKKGKKLAWKQIAAPGSTPGSAPGSQPGSPPGSTSTSCATGGSCVVGDTGPGGGKVFYIVGKSNLEAAPNGWNGGADPQKEWCNLDTNLGTGTAIGTGTFNTNLMIAACASGAGNTARSYRGGGKTDWSLPSLAEVDQMYLQRALIGGLDVGLGYWSSSQFNATLAWYELFNSGFQTNPTKRMLNSVRPVRAFLAK